MKRVFRFIMLAIIGSALLSSCSQKPDSASASGDVKVRIPWQNEKGEYKLQLIELSGLSSLYEMSGAFARFFFAPGIQDNHLIGEAPHGRFIKISGDEFVPANELSKTLATIYAHMQRLAALDAKAGVGDVNQWPRDIGVGVRVNNSNSAMKENNAFYDGKTDSLLFVPYVGQDLPISVNAGILAHEHFHSLFYKIVIKPNAAKFKQASLKEASNHDAQAYYKSMGLDLMSPFGEQEEFDSSDINEKVRGLYHLAILRGLNEGLADFWAWIYTGDTDFVTRSLPKEKQRTLKAASPRIYGKSDILRHVQNFLRIDRDKAEGYTKRFAYYIGTDYSRAFKNFTDLYASEHSVSSREARGTVAAMVLKVLPSFAQGYVAALGKGEYEPTDVFTQFVAQNSLSQKECEHFADIVTLTTGSSYDCKDDQGAFKIKIREAVTP